MSRKNPGSGCWYADPLAYGYECHQYKYASRAEERRRTRLTPARMNIAASSSSRSNPDSMNLPSLVDVGRNLRRSMKMK